tara:strand:- start:4435 stop:5991 length:1557 start_codon:yes stop_codon:yes gene_type:complete
MTKNSKLSLFIRFDKVIGSRVVNYFSRWMPKYVLSLDNYKKPFKNKKKILLGDFIFGFHKNLNFSDYKYFAIISSPEFRLKSLYNSILESSGTNLKKILIKDRISFSKFIDLQGKIQGIPSENFCSKALGIDIYQEEKIVFKDIDKLIKNKKISLFSFTDYDYLIASISRFLKIFFFYPLRPFPIPNSFVNRINKDLINKINNKNKFDKYLYDQICNLKHKKTCNYFVVKLNQILQRPIEPIYKKYINLNYKFRSSMSKINVREKKISFQSFGKIRLMYVNKNELRGKRYIHKKNWEDFPHLVWREAAKICDTIVDVGSNYGEFLILLDVSKKLIYSIEPNSNVLKFQIKTLSNLKNENEIHFINKLASSKIKDQFISINSYDSGNSSIFRPLFGKKVLMSSIRVDSLKLTKNIAMKIDTEGFDLEVIEGSNRIFSPNNKIFITFESNASQLEMIQNLKNKISDDFEWYFYSKNNFIKWNEFKKIEVGNSFFDVYFTNITQIKKMLRKYNINDIIDEI